MKLLMKKLLLAFILAIGLWNVDGQNKANKPAVFVLDATILASNKAKIKGKDPAKLPAYQQLLKDAGKALKFGPVSVMEKKNLPPSGDPHDYMSLAPYHWPDSSKPNGLPYMRKDGQTNPEVKEYKDKEYLPKLCEAVHTLSLAWYFSGEKQYANHAAKLLRVWFLDKATRMNPNLNFGQAIKGVNTGRGAGMIDARHLLKVTDAVGLLQGSKVWTTTDHLALQGWFKQFLQWMQTSAIGLDEMDAPNNHGAWYDAQRLSYALLIDSLQLAKKIVRNAQNRLDKQMDSQGKFPLEMARTTSLHYSVFVMDAFFAIAQMSEKVGIDFWAYQSPSGKSLQKAFDEIKPYLLKEKQWEGPQIKVFDVEESFSMLATGTKKFGCKNCKAGIKNLAGEKAKSLQINLLYE